MGLSGPACAPVATGCSFAPLAAAPGNVSAHYRSPASKRASDSAGPEKTLMKRILATSQNATAPLRAGGDVRLWYSTPLRVDDPAFRACVRLSGLENSVE